MPEIPDPYARSIFRGKQLDNATITRLRQAEARLGYELTIVQGIGGAEASAGTHTEGRAIDLAAYDHARKVRVLRDLGFAAWFRPALPGVWSEHIHAVLILDGRDNQRGLAPAGWRQIGSYDRGRNGLANDAVDTNTYRPTPARGFSMADYRATFATPEPKPVRNNVTRARDRLVEAIHAAGQATALLDDVDPKRVRARKQIAAMRDARGQLTAILDALPKQ